MSAAWWSTPRAAPSAPAEMCIRDRHPHTPIQFWSGERTGRDRPDKPDYKVKLSCAFCFCPAAHVIEHYHNSSWLEHGGSPEKAMRSAFLSAMDGWLKQNGKYTKNEGKITWPDVQETLIFVSNNLSTQTSYENQTKKLSLLHIYRPRKCLRFASPAEVLHFT